MLIQRLDMTTKKVRDFRSEKVPRPELPSLGGFGHLRPLDLEIGCGVGFHPIRYAKQFPERDLVAIEHTAIKFEKFKRRLDHHPEIKNVLPIHGNAISWVTHYAPVNVFEKVFLLYPNPNHFWYRHPFMHQILKVMKPGAILELRTNLKDYAEEAALYFQDAFEMECVLQSQIVSAPGYEPATHFEKKYLLRGEACVLQQWKKI